MVVAIYHNPRCSKSREALRLLTEAGAEPRIVLYLDTPPSAEELRALAAKLGLSPRQMMRKGERIYAELGLDDESLGDGPLFAAMAANPILIERPIVVSGRKALVARPPERALELLR